MRPEQQQIIQPLYSRATELMTNPGAGLEPIRSSLRNAVNANYAGVDQAIRDKMLSSGGGASGKAGSAMLQADLARRGQLTGVDSDIARMMLEQQDRGTSLAERLLAMNFGQDVSGTSSDTSYGEGVVPGSPLASGLGGGINSLFRLFGINEYLKSLGSQPFKMFWE